MNHTTPTTIRLSITPEVRAALDVAKRRYPTLSDPELLKLGLAKIVTEYDDVGNADNEHDEIRRSATASVGREYLTDLKEDIYSAEMGKKVSFS